MNGKSKVWCNVKLLIVALYLKFSISLGCVFPDIYFLWSEADKTEGHAVSTISSWFDEQFINKKNIRKKRYFFTI